MAIGLVLRRCYGRKIFCRLPEPAREGRVALGYATWAKCCEEEFGYSKQHANRLIQAAKISQQVGTIVPTEPLPESHARELGKVPAPGLPQGQAG